MCVSLLACVLIVGREFIAILIVIVDIMKTFKKILFAISFIPLMLVYMVAVLGESILSGCAEACHLWEGWCFEYKKEGYKRSNGLWVKTWNYFVDKD